MRKSDSCVNKLYDNGKKRYDFTRGSALYEKVRRFFVLKLSPSVP